MSSLKNTNTIARLANRTRPTIRLAIIGCGPRGLQCLESLSRNLSTSELSRLRITIFEPSSSLGGGIVYDPSQPRELRMNFASHHIDFWRLDADDRTPISGSLMGWMQNRYPDDARSHRYVPRAVVGEYLHDCFRTVVQRLRAYCDVRVRHAAVDSIDADVDGWLVRFGERQSQFDRVVVTTGHEGLRPNAAVQSTSAEDDSGTESEQRFIFPADPNMSTDTVPAGSNVVVTGFGLTAIDAMLLLSEGRGGKFDTPRIGDAALTPSVLLPSYRRSGLEPMSVTFESRSGRPMLAKPSAFVEPISDDFWTPFRQRLSERMKRHGSIEFRTDIWEVVIHAAASLLCDGRPNSPTCVESTAIEVEQWFRAWSRYRMDAATAQRAMLQSLAVAMGRRRKDAAFGLAESWRRLYPQIVALVSRGGLRADQYETYRRIAAEMERIAFGPPPQNVAKLLRLMRDGQVRLRCIGDDHSPADAQGTASSTSVPSCRREFEPTAPTIRRCAVISPPSAADAVGPIAGLIQRGIACVDALSGGVMTDPRGEVSKEYPGMAIFGRATEGWIVGNDTLTRTMHDEIERWSKNFAHAAAE